MSNVNIKNILAEKDIFPVMIKKTLILWTIVTFLVVIFIPISSNAADKYWVGGAPTNWWDWDDPNSSILNWSLTDGGAGTALRPYDGDDVYLYQNGSSDKIVRYYNAYATSAVFNSLNIDATGTGTMTLQMHTNHSFTTNNEYIGINYNGTGIFDQNTGTHTVNNDLYLGVNNGSSGTYNLSGTGILSVYDEWVGDGGVGTFNQSGGTHTVSNDLDIGTGSTYNLSGGTLSVDTEFNDGSFIQTGGTHTVDGALTTDTYDLSSGSLEAYNEVVDTFVQTGGTNTITDTLKLNNTYTLSGGTLDVGSTIFSALGPDPDLIIDGGTLNAWGGINNINIHIGYSSGSNASYTMSGDNISTYYEYVGYNGDGTFIQTGGTNWVGTELHLGVNPGSSGTYTLLGGRLYVDGSIIDGAGMSTINVDGGTLAPNPLAIDIDNFNVGYTSGSNGSFSIGLDKSVSADFETIGYSGTGAITQTGGTNTVSNNMYLGYNSGSSGTYTQSSGDNIVSNNLYLGYDSGSSGTYNLSGTLLTDLSAYRQYIGYSGTGTFIQSGGENVISDNLYLGYISGSSGTYTLSGGSLQVNGDIINNSGNSTLNMDGGTLILSSTSLDVDFFNIGSSPGSSGGYTLDSGETLSAFYERIGYNGTGIFTQDGGTHTISGTLSIGDNASGDGTYTLNGGELSTNIEIIGNDGDATFTQTGGAHTTSGYVYLGYGSSDSDATYTLSGGTYDVGGNIANGDGTGTLNIDGGTLTIGVGSIDVDNFNVGYNTGSNGNHTLGTGETLTAGYERIGSDGTGTFTQAGGTHTISDDLYLGESSGSSGAYNLNNGSLSAEREYIGHSGIGAFTQTGGTNTVSTYLYIGHSSGSNGTYTLSEGSLLADIELVGRNSTGIFTQTGGTNTVSSNLYLGTYASGNGTYTLRGGTLEVGGNIDAGSGTSTLNMDGGTLIYSGEPIDVDYFNVGYTAGSNGNHAIGSGTSLLADYETIGGSGIGALTLSGGANTVSNDIYLGYNSGSSGTFTQTGGTNTVGGTLVMAEDAGSSGYYDLQGGTLSAGTVQLNSGGTFEHTGGILEYTTFNQNGGTIDSNLQNQATFNYTGGSFSGGQFINQGMANITGGNFSPEDGIENQETLNITSGATVTLSGSDGLDNQGTLSLSGTLGGSNALINYGNMNIDGGTITGSGGFTNYTMVTQADDHCTLSNTGVNANYGSLDLATGYQFRLNSTTLTNGGTLNLDGGIITGSGTLDNTYGGILSGRGTIAAGFANSGGVMVLEDGSTNVTQAFTNSGVIQLAGYSANLTGGAITNTGGIEGYGQVANDMTNTGTIEGLGGTLTLSGSVSNNSGGLITASTGTKVLMASGMSSNAGVISLTGGTFDNNGHSMTNTGSISGYGTLRTGGLTNDNSVTLTGDTSIVNGDITNNASLNVAYNSAIFTGDVVNYGTVKISDTTVIFSGTYTENGAYISDPSDNYFEDLIVGDTGYLNGGVGDNWYVRDDFINNSQRNEDWSTNRAYLEFRVGEDNAHDFFLAGTDYGAVWEAYIDNFSWGTMCLAAGNELNLFNGNGITGAALYLRELLGANIDSGIITNIFGSEGLNIYYLAGLDANAYLDGQTYDLSGGGQLIATNTPIPGAMWLMASGLLCLVAIRRKSNKNRSETMHTITIKKAITVFAVIGLFWTFLTPLPVEAEDRHWVVDTGKWDVDTNWNMESDGSGKSGIPLNGDNAYLLQDDSTSRTVIYNDSVDLNNFIINATGAGTMTLDIGGAYNLSAAMEIIGFDGTAASNTGSVTQADGTNTISNSLSLGSGQNSNGTYELSGGSLSAYREYIGRYGTGTFTQSGGTNTVSFALNLGYYSKSNGTYNLIDGNLSANYEYVGNDGKGTFIQSGGAHTVSGNLYIGYSSEGDGMFKQYGGTNTVTGTLTIAKGAGSEGTYDLHGGTLTAGTVQLNDNGIFALAGGTLDAATFNQDGGEVYGTLQNQGTFNYNSGTFNDRLINHGIVNFNADFTAGNGMDNQTALDIAAGRTVTLNGAGFDNNGTLSLSGTLAGNGAMVNYGSMDLDGGTIAGSGGFTNYAMITQSDDHCTLSNTGTNTNYGNIDLASGYQFRLNGATLTNSSALNLNNGIVAGSGTLDNSYGGTIAGGGTIASNFANNGGVIVVENGNTNITQTFTNGGLIQVTGLTANLTGGAITSSGSIQGYGQVANDINNTGTIEALNGTLILGGTVNNNAGGLMSTASGTKLLMAGGMSSNAGVITLKGGTFDNNSQTLTNTDQITGYGILRTGGLTNNDTLTLTGGTTTVNGDVTNNSDLNIAHDQAIFTGDVVNYGTVKITDTTVTFTGSYTESGLYISDPSDNYFTDLTIEDGGALKGSVGDNWHISNDFINNSLKNETWNTNLAFLEFFTGDDSEHDFFLAGADYGAAWEAYTNNFSWGTMSLAAGNILNLLDGNDVTGGALYLRELLGAVISGGSVTNISGSDGLNIYYLAGLDANAYLGGQTFDLAGGGQLIATNTPIPGAVWLLASGLVCLIGIRRKTQGQKVKR